MNNLTTVVTRFPLPAEVSSERIRAAFEEVAPRFRNVPGLIRKPFLRSKDCRTAGGVYLWNDETTARAFMNERVAPMIREKFHVDPTIEFFDSPLVVENRQASGQVHEVATDAANETLPALQGAGGFSRSGWAEW